MTSGRGPWGSKGLRGVGVVRVDWVDWVVQKSNKTIHCMTMPQAAGKN